MWAITWLSILAATLVAVLVLLHLSQEGSRDAVERALTEHLLAQAGIADGALRDLPVEIVSTLDGAGASALSAQVDRLAERGRLRGLALLGPRGEVVGRGARWIPGAAERDLIRRAAAGERVRGPLYTDEHGQPYETAYQPLTGHAGWVVAVEGSAATLGAVDQLVLAERRAAIVVIAIAGAVGAALATVLWRPLRRLAHEIGAASPGSAPSSIGRYGFAELARVADAARSLLAAIVQRDEELREAHGREVAQLTRMAAEIAHEVGNPLNAVTLGIEYVARVDDPGERTAALDRIRTQLDELGRIVARLRDLTRPLRPEWAAHSLDDVLDALVGTVAGLEVRRVGEGGIELRTDAVMLTEIVRNLLLNARQAGASRAAVSVTRSGEGVEISVEDDGPGIALENAPLLFEWFHTTRSAGTGLGLPVSRRLAEALGGTLELIAPRPATFRLRLPEGPAFQESA